MKDLLSKCNTEAIFLNTQDEFLSEFTKPENNDVLQITGFTGSNGYALITANQNFLFTDGRYTLQAKNELPSNYIIHDVSHFFTFLKEQPLKSIAFNFERVSTIFVNKIKESIPNIINLQSPSKKFQSSGKFYEIDGGISSKEKITKITEHLKQNNKTGFLISNPQNVCWLLNVRGNDEEFTPVFKAKLFIESNGNYTINPKLEEISGSIFIESSINYFDFTQINAQKEFDETPTNLKAIKNKTEIEGIINAHKIDGKALSHFLFLLEIDYAYKTEHEIAEKLLQIRRCNKEFKTPSFATICGCNENSAIIHYHATPQNAKTVGYESVLLIDSGGQYHGKNTLGTTDVTRTLFLGSNPSQEYKTAFTLVLKGHIAVANAVFETTTPASYFDLLARHFLKQNGMNYPHSTGHGVGSFLSVHEGGYGISSKSNYPLKEGMLLSNEPGFYLEGKFGIRIENLILVQKRKDGKLHFKTVTLVPIQEKSIDFTLLTETEKQWLENYNRECFNNSIS